MSEAAFWLALALIGAAAIGLLWLALRRHERRDGYEPIEHEVDGP